MLGDRIARERIEKLIGEEINSDHRSLRLNSEIRREVKQKGKWEKKEK